MPPFKAQCVCIVPPESTPKNSTFYTHGLFLIFLGISELKVITPLGCVNRLCFIIGEEISLLCGTNYIFVYN
jgi:hypothetical protein